MTKFYAYCPGCGERQEVKTFANMRPAADEHNAKCRPKRQKPEYEPREDDE